MNAEAFARQVDALSLRIADLQREGGSKPASVGRAFTELEEALEALRQAVEELQTREHDLEAARRAVDAERLKFRELFEFAPDGYLVTDMWGTVREANRAACEMLEIEPKSLLGTPLAVFVTEAGRMAFRSELRWLAEAKAVAEYELILQPRRRGPFHASVWVMPAWDDAGQPAWLRWIVRDVSARHRAEAAIRALNAELSRRVVERTKELETELEARERLLIEAHAGHDLLKTLVQEADAILWRADADGRYTFVSRRAEGLLGYAPEAWLADAEFWADRLHPEDREWAVGHRRRQLQQARDHEAEYRLLAKDGRVVWFRESVRVVRDEQGHPRELHGVMVNISKRKKVERQLYSSKSELAARVDDLAYLNELIVRLSTVGRLEDLPDQVLTSALSIVGAESGVLFLLDADRDALDPAAQAGLSPECVGALVRMPRWGNPAWAAIEQRQGLIVQDVEEEAEYAVCREAFRAGGLRSVLCVPLVAGSGEVLGALSIYFAGPQRLPERPLQLAELYAKQASDLLAGLRRRLEVGRKDLEREAFLSVVARELRGSLDEIFEAAKRVLVGAEGGGGPGPPEFREVVEEQARQMSRLVGDLLEPGRLSTVAVERRTERLDLGRALEQAAAGLRPSSAARGLGLVVEPAGGPAWIMADADDLRRVLGTLLERALEASEPGGRVGVAIVELGGRVELRVRGTGMIAGELLGASNGVKGVEGGDAPGLRGDGLWLVRWLVERQGGTITVSVDGRGCVVAWPLA